MGNDELLKNMLGFAYQMEVEITKILESHLKDAVDYPEIKERLKQHLEETKRHAEMMEECLNDAGGEKSNLTESISKLMGTFMGSSNMIGNKVLFNLIAKYATENLEIAVHKALVVTATELGEDKTAENCSQILDEEFAMADWLDENFEDIIMTELGTVEEEETEEIDSET